MPTPLPALVKLEGAGAVPNSDDFRLGIGDMRRFLAGLLGVTGEVVDAVNALGLTKVSGDCLQTRVSAPAIAAASDRVGDMDTLAIRSTPSVFTPKKASSLILVKCSIRFFQVPELYSNIEFGLYQDAALISENFQARRDSNVYNPQGAYIGNGYANINDTAVLSAIISNTALTPRSFNLKTRIDGVSNANITRALWEISEYVA